MKFAIFAAALIFTAVSAATLPALAQTESGPAAAAAPAAAAEKEIYSSKAAVEASIKAVPCEQDKRLEGVRQLFIGAGVPEAEVLVEKLDNGKISNVVVKKKGQTDETVVIGAHYDRVLDGCGVTDNWSGVAIIAHMLKTIRTFDTKKSYVFVAFDGEEEGLKGSRHMLKEMPEAETAKICSMVNFDSFGQGYPMALENASSIKMLKLAKDLGKEAGFKFQSVEIAGASSDSASFKAKKIPAITLSGLNNEWQSILHSKSDKVEKVQTDSVYLGYRYGLMFLAKLDAAGCGDFK